PPVGLRSLIRDPPASTFDSRRTLFAELTQKLKRVDSRLVTVAEVDLVGVVSDGRHGGRPDGARLPRLQDVEDRGRLGSLMPASSAGTPVAQRAPGNSVRDPVAPLDQQCLAISLERFRR